MSLTRITELLLSKGAKVVEVQGRRLTVKSAAGTASADVPTEKRANLAPMRAIRLAAEKSDAVVFGDLKAFLELVPFSRPGVAWSDRWIDAAHVSMLASGTKEKMNTLDAASAYASLGDQEKWLYRNVIGPSQAAVVQMQRRRLLFDWEPRRVYYSTASAVAGRLSTPIRDGSLNLHSMPKDQRKRVRPSRNGRLFVSADYVAQEYCVMAAVSGCNRMSAVAASGVDPHEFHTRMILRASPEEVESLRDAAKTLFFVLVYGGGAAAVAKSLSVTRGEAGSLIKAMEALYPDFVEWRAEQERHAKENGEVRSATGRKLKVNSDDEAEVRKMCVNFPVQSLGADLSIAALVALNHALPAEAWPVIHHHDEIGVECSAEQAAVVGEILKKAMCDAESNCIIRRLNSTVLFRAKVKSGSEWS